MESAPVTQEKAHNYTIRTYTPKDYRFVIRHTSLLAGDTPPWRDTYHMEVHMQNKARDLLSRYTHPEVGIFIAEDDVTGPLGYAMVCGQQNFTGEPEAYLVQLVVLPHQEGRGIGTRLIDRCEQWAEEHQYLMLALETGADNGRARALYERLNFQYESVRMVKILRAP